MDQGNVVITNRGKLEMKNFYLSCLAVLLLASTSFPQEVGEKKNFVYAGIGTMSLPEMAHKFLDIWITALSAGYTTSETRNSMPAVTIGYQMHSSERFTFGASITYEVLKTDIVYGARYAGTNQVSFFSPMAEMRFEYISNETFGMYFEYGIGACFLTNTAKYDRIDDSSSKTILSAQVTPLGLRFGNKFRVHLGMGVGMKGLFMASVGMRF